MTRHCTLLRFLLTTAAPGVVDALAGGDIILFLPYEVQRLLFCLCEIDIIPRFSQTCLLYKREFGAETCDNATYYYYTTLRQRHLQRMQQQAHQRSMRILSNWYMHIPFTRFHPALEDWELYHSDSDLD